MKFLIHSNAPTVATGYGVQTAYLVNALAAAGHEVAVSCTYGLQGPISTWVSPSGHRIRMYPAGYITNSPDVIHAHALHWFDNDPHGGWIITLLDVWCLAKHPMLHEFNILAWTPVDHLPCPQEVLDFFKASGALPVPMSEFGGDMLRLAGLDPYVIPLTVDTTVFKPTFEVDVDGETMTSRELFKLPLDAFVVGMVAMNKGWAKDRKGFNEAFRAFGAFWKEHPEAVLYVHADVAGGAEGIDLRELSIHAAIPKHAVVWADQYPYRLGYPPHLMAALYTSFDVLLAPSHGEGFCVPLIEAQACGTPVIASEFSSQSELVGAGWKVMGQLEWDPSQKASYLTPFTADVLAKLELAHGSDLTVMQAEAVEFAARYDTAKVFAERWLPLLAGMEPAPPIERERMESVDVIVPLMRIENLPRLLSSLDPAFSPIVVHDTLLDDEVPFSDVICVGTGKAHTTYAEKVNLALEHSTADFILVVGDDTEFVPGWFEAAQAVSTQGDVIGTNDSEPGRVRNPEVAAGRHADHFFIRRSYIDDEGSSLDGPGVAMPEAYRHWFVDKEVIGLAKARGVYVHAPECRIIHHHPGYDGDEAARKADPTYMRAVDSAEQDQRTFLSRVPLIEAHRKARK